MGIPSYFSHIVKSHRKIIKQYKKNMGIHNLYLDCNSIIYDVVNKIDILVINNNDYEEFILKQTVISISNYIKSIKPANHVIIAFHGVAPITKL